MKHTKIITSMLVLISLVTGTSVSAATLPNTIQEGNYTLVKSKIIVNGHTISTPYVFVAKDSNSGSETTFIPAWDLSSAVEDNGFHVELMNSKTPGTGDLTVVDDYTYVNGQLSVASQKPSFYKTGIPIFNVYDPIHGVNTTYFPLYYAQHYLDLLGLYNTWNGKTHTLTMPAEKLVITPNAQTIEEAQQEAIQNQSEGRTNVYGMLSTSSQWFNDPHVKFYDKRFPVSDLKDGYVIQENPYTVVFKNNYPDHTVIAIAQYIGQGVDWSELINAYQHVTLWKEEFVDPSSGKVIKIYPSICFESFNAVKNYLPNIVHGINFGYSADDYAGLGGNGQGLDVVPSPITDLSVTTQNIESEKNSTNTTKSNKADSNNGNNAYSNAVAAHQKLVQQSEQNPKQNAVDNAAANVENDIGNLEEDSANMTEYMSILGGRDDGQAYIDLNDAEADHQKGLNMSKDVSKMQNDIQKQEKDYQYLKNQIIGGILAKDEAKIDADINQMKSDFATYEQVSQEYSLFAENFVWTLSNGAPDVNAIIKNTENTLALDHTTENDALKKSQQCIATVQGYAAQVEAMEN